MNINGYSIADSCSPKLCNSFFIDLSHDVVMNGSGVPSTISVFEAAVNGVGNISFDPTTKNGVKFLDKVRSVRATFYLGYQSSVSLNDSNLCGDRVILYSTRSQDCEIITPDQMQFVNQLDWDPSWFTGYVNKSFPFCCDNGDNIVLEWTGFGLGINRTNPPSTIRLNFYNYEIPIVGSETNILTASD